MITSLYPFIGTRDIRDHNDAANLLEIIWRERVKRRIAQKLQRHLLPFKFKVVK